MKFQDEPSLRNGQKSALQIDCFDFMLMLINASVVLEERQTAGEKLRSQMCQCYHFMRPNKILTEMY